MIFRLVFLVVAFLSDYALASYPGNPFSYNLPQGKNFVPPPQYCAQQPAFLPNQNPYQPNPLQNQIYPGGQQNPIYPAQNQPYPSPLGGISGQPGVPNQPYPNPYYPNQGGLY